MTFDRRAFIEKKLPHFVSEAEGFLERFPIYSPGHKPRVSTSQLKNLLAAAQGGSPVAILRNFLHYQMGRDKKSLAWNDHDSAHGLIALLEREVEKPVKDLGLGEDERYRLEAELAAQLIGFLSREYTYRVAVDADKIRLPKGAA